LTSDPVWRPSYGVPSDVREVAMATVECDDWIGLYLNDELVFEGHSLPWHKLMEFLDGCYIAEWTRYGASTEWMEETGLGKRITSISPQVLRRIEGTELPNVHDFI
jgi:hypothetical protein